MNHKDILKPANAGHTSFMRACAHAAYALYVPRMSQRPATMDADFEKAIENHSAFILEVDGRLAGYAVWFAHNGTFFIENIAIAPAHQGMGLGRFLMEQGEVIAQTQGCETITLYTNVTMVENIAFYTRLGFVETKRATQDGFQRVFMEKSMR